MPSPVSPQTLQELVPPRNGSFCGRWIPGIINWMQERANFYRWMYKDNGDLTVSFLTDLCIAKNGTVTPDPTTCPSVALSATVIVRDEEVRLTFTGVGMTAGYTYSLYRSTSVSGPWGSAITTGTTTGTTISYTDTTGLTNGTEYFYRLTVQKTGCPATSFVTSGTPRECIPFDFQLTVTSDGAGIVHVKAANVYADYAMEGTFEYVIGVDGIPVASGVISDSSCTLNGSIGLCKDLSNVEAGSRLIAVSITEKAGCTAVIHYETVSTEGEKPSTPSVTIAQGRIIIQYGGGTVIPVAYKIFHRAIGSCLTESFFREIGPVPPNTGANYVLPISRSMFPCTENTIPPSGGPGGTPGFCNSKYEIYAVAYSASGGVSDPSNVALMTYPALPLWPGQCT